MTARRLESMTRVKHVLAEAKRAIELRLAGLHAEAERLAKAREELVRAFNGDAGLQALFATEIARGLQENALQAAALRDVRHAEEQKLAIAARRLKLAEILVTRLDGEAARARAKRELEDIIASGASLP
jgi:hypothetical protein